MVNIFVSMVKKISVLCAYVGIWSATDILVPSLTLFHRNEGCFPHEDAIRPPVSPGRQSMPSARSKDTFDQAGKLRSSDQLALHRLIVASYRQQREASWLSGT